MIGTSREGGGLDSLKSHGLGYRSEVHKLLGRQKANDGMVVLAGLEILTQRDPSDTILPKIGQNLVDFIPRLTQSEHHSTLGDYTGNGFTYILEQVQ